MLRIYNRYSADCCKTRSLSFNLVWAAIISCLVRSANPSVKSQVSALSLYAAEVMELKNSGVSFLDLRVVPCPFVMRTSIKRS